MQDIPFVKYTSCGNNFVIVDDVTGSSLSESELSRFAYQATNPYFGIGSDNLLVIQSCEHRTLAEINRLRGYWRTLPDPGEADYLFRMFEPCGEEALCCGNGLMCIADYLSRRYGISSARIMTELPFVHPRALEIGTDPVQWQSWVNLGQPRRTPEVLVDRSAVQVVTDQVDLIDSLHVRFRSHDLFPFSDETELDLSGYLVFTGEPHLVMFPEQAFSLPEVAGTMFSTTVPHVTETSGACKRLNFGTWLLRRVGAFLNSRCKDLFPSGINVNFVRVDTELGAIEYRCFERGIDRETLACGTGALAVAYVVRALGKMQGDAFDVIPHRCRWYDAQALIQVTADATRGWTLKSTPRMLCEGRFMAAAFAGRGAQRGTAGRQGEEAAATDLDASPARGLPLAS